MSILRLKEVLKEKGISGKSLAEKVGVTQATISNISSGNHFPKQDLLINIAQELDIDIRDLFYPTKEKKSVKDIIQGIKSDLDKIEKLCQ